jgi:hypothetical protein
VIIAQTRIPDDTNETTQVKALLDTIDLTRAVVTADAAHASRETAAYIAGQRAADYPLTVKGNTPGLQRAIYDKIQAECDASAPDHSATDRAHGRTVRRSLWAAAADESTGFPRAAQVIRIRRDTYDMDGMAVAKEIVHAATSLDAIRGTPGGPGRAGPRAVGDRGRPLDPRHRLPRGPQHRLRRRRTPGHGHPTPQSACSASPGSPRSPAPSRHSAATAPES